MPAALSSVGTELSMPRPSPIAIQLRTVYPEIEVASLTQAGMIRLAAAIIIADSA